MIEAITPDPAQVEATRNLIGLAAGGRTNPAVTSDKLDAPKWQETPLADGGFRTAWNEQATFKQPSDSGATEITAAISGEREFTPDASPWRKDEAHLTVTNRIKPSETVPGGKVLQSKVSIVGVPHGDEIIHVPMETRTKAYMKDGKVEMVQSTRPVSDRRLKAAQHLIDMSYGDYRS